MDKDIWIVHISDYRSWKVRLYIELYKANDYYTTIFYDIKDSVWDFKDKQDRDKMDIDFMQLQKLVRRELQKELKNNRIDSVDMAFNKLANYTGYNIYCIHPKFKTEYQKKKSLQEIQEQLEKKRIKKECRCECGGYLSYVEINIIKESRVLLDDNKLDKHVNKEIMKIVNSYLECGRCGQKYNCIKKRNKYIKGEKINL